MRKLTVFLLLLTLWVGVAQPRAASREEDAKQLFREIQDILSELSEISGLKPLRSVQHDLIDKTQIKQFLEDRIQEAVKPEEIRADELTLKKFGFAPPEFDLKKTTIELLTEQAAAFYDYKKKKLFVLDSAPSGMQQVALVHELAHALADQHFNLEKFIERGSKSDDTATARLAVMEGQATWLMSEYIARRSGQSLKTSPAIVQMMSRSADMSAGQFPVYDSAPLYIRETLVFPYSQGMLFQHAVFEKFGKEGFSEVFRHPPLSTQDILHPEKYFAGVKPAVPPLPAVANGRDYRELVEGTIGELDHSLLLRQFIGKDEAEDLAPRWTGGKYRLLERKSDGRTVLVYAVQWASPEAARRYFELYQRVLKAKWKTMRIDSRSDTAISGQGDDGEFLLRLDGLRVTSLEGMPPRGEPRGALR